MEVSSGKIAESFSPSLSPLHDLRFLDDCNTWQSTGIDPQFVVIGPWPQCPTRISLEIETDEGITGSSRLYADRGKGYSEEESYDLGEVNREQVNYVPLSSEVVRLRLDPLAAVGQFKIKKLVFECISDL